MTAVAPLPEARRRAYMKAMGYPVVYALSDLPGARPGRLVGDIASDSRAAAKPADAVSTAPATTPRASDASHSTAPVPPAADQGGAQPMPLSALFDSPADSAAKAARAADAATPIKAASKDKPERVDFRLLLIEDLLFVDDSDHGSTPETDVRLLCTNIARALGRMSSGAVEIQHQRWPPSPGASGTPGEFLAAAVTALKPKGALRVVMLGSRTGAWLAPALPADLTGATGPSVRRMLAQPDSKAELWAAIRGWRQG